MTKILLEFDSIEDREDWEIAVQANKMYAVLTDLQDEFRRVMKYGKPHKRDRYWAERLQELLEERSVKL
jgi:hypothetical protein